MKFKVKVLDVDTSEILFQCEVDKVVRINAIRESILMYSLQTDTDGRSSVYVDITDETNKKVKYLIFIAYDAHGKVDNTTILVK